MAMGLHFLKTHFIPAILLLFFSISISIAKPNCTDRCGNVSIPFPFGTTKDCYLHRSFFVNCNDTHYDPSKAFLGNSAINITSISLEGQLQVWQFIAKDCYSLNGSRYYNDPWIQIPRYLAVNNTANKFTVVGCDTRGFVSGNRVDRKYQTGCSSLCASEDDLDNGSCSGVGCCQTSIPKDVWRVNITLESFNQYKNYDNLTNKWDFNSCSYAFVVEETSFTFSPRNLYGLRNVKKLPMVLDWAIGNETCESAKKNLSSYACLSNNSECRKPDNGHGYRCYCLKGYRGNPYLVDGCEDIDECKDPSLNDCEKDRCVDIEGSFQCVCPKGYQGEGKTDGRGCVRIRGESLSLKLVA
ncbi:wall-associated receptor kinase 2-like, partial [Olea europaea var. sylvestris]|uniref:wall-associated receptor kinase 2-like n=1 Tax=Olea europaea var. sylvestris TaxID=158386 RepID=UPI000C1CE0D7